MKLQYVIKNIVGNVKLMIYLTIPVRRADKMDLLNKYLSRAKKRKKILLLLVVLALIVISIWTSR